MIVFRGAPRTKGAAEWQLAHPLPSPVGFKIEDHFNLCPTVADTTVANEPIEALESSSTLVQAPLRNPSFLPPSTPA